MQQNIDIISVIFSFIFVTFYGLRSLKLTGRVNTASFFINLFWVCTLPVFFAQALFLLNYISFEYFLNTIKSSYLAQSFTVLGIIALILIKEYSQKKLKTLWRLPIIGFLVGMFIEYKYFDATYVVVLLFSLILLIKQREYYRFILRKYIVYLIAAITVLYFDINRMFVVNINLCLALIIFHPILTSLNIGSRFKFEEIKE